MIHRAFTTACAIALLTSIVGCGSEELPPATEPDGDLFPLTVGDSWLYEENDGTTVTRVQYEVTDFAAVTFGYDVGEKDVFFIKNTFPDGGGDTDSPDGWRMQYYLDDGTRVGRLRHDVYDDVGALTKTRDYVPGFLRFDRSKTAVGDQWTEEYVTYTDSTPQDTAGVVQEEASYLYEVLEPATVTVPAGTFEDCVVWQRTKTSGTSAEIKIYYYFPGVGKVKEITEGTKEEVLKEYQVASTADGGV